VGEGALPQRGHGRSTWPSTGVTRASSLPRCGRPATPWSVYPPSNGPGGALRSVDGEHLTRIDGNGMPVQHGRIGLAVAPPSEARVRDGRRRRRGRPRPLRRRGCALGACRKRTIASGSAAGTSEGDGGPPSRRPVYPSTQPVRLGDGGRTFTLTKGSPGGDDYHELWIDPQDPTVRSSAPTRGGRDPDGGRTWSSWYNQSTAQIYECPPTAGSRTGLRAAQAGLGGRPCPAAPPDDGINLTQFREITAGARAQNMCPPAGSPVVYGGTVEKLDLRTMQTQSVDPTLAGPGEYRTAWTLRWCSPAATRASSTSPTEALPARGRRPALGADSAHLTVRRTPACRDSRSRHRRHRPPPGPDAAASSTHRASRVADGDVWSAPTTPRLRDPRQGADVTNLTPASLTPWSRSASSKPPRSKPRPRTAAVDRHA